MKLLHLKSPEKLLKENFSEISMLQLGLSNLTNKGSEDANLSIGSWDTHINNIRTKLDIQAGYMSALMNNLGLFSGGIGDDSWAFENIKIEKMVRNNIQTVDIYLIFDWNENTYRGVMKNYGTNLEMFDSRVLKEYYFSANKENEIKIKNIMRIMLDYYYTPEKGEYISLADNDNIINDEGLKILIKKNSKIKLLECKNNDYGRSIIIEKDGKIGYITGQNFYFFNWWFKSVEKVKYYI